MNDGRCVCLEDAFARVVPDGACPSPCCSDEVLDLLDKLLRFDPDERCTVDEAMSHPFLKRYHSPAAVKPCKPFSFEFDVGL